MKILIRLVTVMFILTHLHNGRACQNDIKETESAIPKFSTQKGETMDKPFEKHFDNSEQDNHFLKAHTITLNNKDYPWHIHDSHREILSDRKDLHTQVLNELNNLEKESFEDQDKIIGFSLDVCNDKVSVNPYLSGMDKILTSSTDDVTFIPITTSFPCFLGSMSSSVPSNWPAALSNISKDVLALHSEQHIHNLSYAHTSIKYLSLHYFNQLVNFCKSDSCDLSSRAILFSLFSLVPSIINNFPIPSEDDCILYDLQDSSEISKLTVDFGIFLKNSCTTAFPLVLDSNIILFNSVGKLIGNFESWLENRE